MVTDPFPEDSAGSSPRPFGDRRSCGWFEWEQSPTHRVIYVTGEVDMSNAEDLQQGLEELDGRQLTVDLRKVAFVDSTGLGALVRMAEAVAPRRLELLIEEASQVDRLLALSGMEDVFGVRRR